MRPAHAAKPIRCRALIAARVLIALLCSALAPPSPAADIAVIYPETAKPYSEIFERIIDGVEQGHGTSGGDLAAWSDTYSLVFGSELTGTNPWLGELHHVALYNRALSPAEISRHLQGGPGASER